MLSLYFSASAHSEWQAATYSVSAIFQVIPANLDHLSRMHQDLLELHPNLTRALASARLDEAQQALLCGHAWLESRMTCLWATWIPCLAMSGLHACDACVCVRYTLASASFFLHQWEGIQHHDDDGYSATSNTGLRNLSLARWALLSIGMLRSLAPSHPCLHQTAVMKYRSYV